MEKSSTHISLEGILRTIIPVAFPAPSLVFVRLGRFRGEGELANVEVGYVNRLSLRGT